MKENEPLALVTLCLVIALIAAVTEVKVLRQQVKSLKVGDPIPEYLKKRGS